VKRPEKQGGFTLMELIIVVFILGLFATMASKLYNQGLHAWFDGYASFKMQMQVRAARDHLAKNSRDALAASVQVTRTNTAEALYSALTFVDVYGDTGCYYQSGNDFMYALQKPGKALITQTLLKGDLQRFYVYYPDFKDMTKMAYSLYATKSPYPNGKTVEVLMRGTVDLRNP
jgi:prepilin-type N-terminal cleavage/methylation domain-containing protein